MTTKQAKPEKVTNHYALRHTETKEFIGVVPVSVPVDEFHHADEYEFLWKLGRRIVRFTANPHKVEAVCLNPVAPVRKFMAPKEVTWMTFKELIHAQTSTARIAKENQK